MLQLCCTVQSVVYRNENNGYSVISVMNNGAVTTAVGMMTSVSVGDELKLIGNWKVHSVYGKHKKSDLRQMDFRSKEPMVCLEIEKSDDQVLLSDEENWHFVFSNWYFSKSEEDYNTFELMSPNEQEIIKTINEQI